MVKIACFSIFCIAMRHVVSIAGFLVLMKAIVGQRYRPEMAKKKSKISKADDADKKRNASLAEKSRARNEQRLLPPECLSLLGLTCFKRR